MQIHETLTGPRLVLRSHREEDLDFVCSMWLDEENGRYLSDPLPDHVDERYQKALDGLTDSPYGYYLTAVERETGRKVGTCCAFPNEDRTVFDIGYCVHRDHWRRGFGSEILALLEDWIFAQGAVKITAEAAVENAASCHLLEKRGFRAVGTSSFRKYHMDTVFESFLYEKCLKNG